MNDEREEAYRAAFAPGVASADDLREREGLRRLAEQDIAKAFRVPPWLIGTAPRPNWLRRNVQRWSGYRFWL